MDEKFIREMLKRHDVDCTIDGMGYGEGSIEGVIKAVIQECCTVINKTAVDEENNWMGNDPPAFAYRMKIKEHFGVK